MIGTGEYMLNKKNNKVRAIATIVMDFPKAFDTLNHNQTCKIKTYGFEKNTSTLIEIYFSNSHQITIKRGDKFSKWKKKLTELPDVSIFRPLFFSTFY